MRKITPERCFLIAFVGFTVAALYSEITGAQSTFDISIHDTYFVIAHVHMYLWLAVLSGFYALFYRYNRRMSRVVGFVHFGMSILGAMVLFWPYRVLAGMPRRYLDYSTWVSFNQEGPDRATMIWLVVVGVLGQVVFFVNVVYSMAGGRKSVD